MIRENNVQKLGTKLMLFVYIFLMCGCNNKKAVSDDVNSEIESSIATKYESSTQGFDYESSDTGTIELSSKMLYDSKNELITNKECIENDIDKNVLLVKNMGKIEVNLSKIQKKGNTNYLNESIYYGLNSAVTAMRKGYIQMKESDIETCGTGANGISCIGKESSVDIADTTIVTKAQNSVAIAATYEGTVKIDDSEITTALDNSDLFYCSGSIIANKVNARAQNSKIATIKGNGSLDIAESELICNCIDCDFEMFRKKTDEMTRLNIIDSVIKNQANSKDFFYVHETNGEIFLTNTTIQNKADTFINIKNANLKLTTMNQSMNGNIKSDENSSLEIILLDNSYFKGAIEKKDGENIVINIDENSTWELTQNSYISVFGNKNINLSNIITNGYNIYYDADNSSNRWLSNKTIELTDGGKLIPVTNKNK